MLTLKQCKDNAYAIAQVMSSVKSFDRAVSSINDICDLDVTKEDLIKLIHLRVEYFQFDLMFLVWE